MLELQYIGIMEKKTEATIKGLGFGIVASCFYAWKVVKGCQVNLQCRGVGLVNWPWGLD